MAKMTVQAKHASYSNSKSTGLEKDNMKKHSNTITKHMSKNDPNNCFKFCSKIDPKCKLDLLSVEGLVEGLLGCKLGLLKAWLFERLVALKYCLEYGCNMFNDFS